MRIPPHFPGGARALGLNGAVLAIPSATSRGLSEYLWRVEQVSHALANGYFVERSTGWASRPRSAPTISTGTAADPRGQFIGGDAARTTRSCSFATWTSTWSRRFARRGSSTATGGRHVRRPDPAVEPRREGGGPMEFGFTIKPEHSIGRTIALATGRVGRLRLRLAVRQPRAVAGPYPLLAIARETSTLRLGTCVTNPATREPSVTASSLAVLQEISGGRFDLGIGRAIGDTRRQGAYHDGHPRGGRPRDRGAAPRVARSSTRAPPSSSPGRPATGCRLYRRLRAGRAEDDRRIADGAMLQPHLVRWSPGRRPRDAGATRTRSRSWRPPRPTSATSRTPATASAGSRPSWATTSSTSSTNTRASRRRRSPTTSATAKATTTCTTRRSAARTPRS